MSKCDFKTIKVARILDGLNYAYTLKYSTKHTALYSKKVSNKQIIKELRKHNLYSKTFSDRIRIQIKDGLKIGNKYYLIKDIETVCSGYRIYCEDKV